MSEKRLEGLDLNLLLALHWLLAERNVTAAADKLGLSQPAASRALGKLRATFDDPLLVKVGGTMAPTRLAEQLQPATALAMERCRDVLKVMGRFDPAEQGGQFRIACADYLGAVVTAAWAGSVAKEAPGLTLEIMSPTLEDATAMATGKTDLCILPNVNMLDLPPSLDVTQFVKKTIVNQDFLCAVRKGHKMAGHRFTLEEYLQSDHALVTSDGDRTGIIDDELARMGHQRNIAYKVGSFLLSISVVRLTDCVLTAPRALLQMRQENLWVFPPPLPLRPIAIHGVWHPNWTHDHRHQWVRQRLFDAMLDLVQCPLFNKPNPHRG
ncbi:MAG: LysR family transcriptional regulator [Pseudomonadota bacterium]